jgi:DNA-3-methyladenine glycosylase II
MGKVRTPTHSGFIETDDDIRRGMKSLRRRCEVMRRIHDAVGDPPLRRSTAGFEGLARVIIAQQLSAASATAIWARVSAAIAPASPATIIAASDEALRTAGLSRPKIRTLRALATAVRAGELDLAALIDANPEEIHDALTRVSGIGPWTADIFILFCLGRADGFAAGDLALQIAAQHAFKLAERPNPVELAAIAERWRPWRAVAARMLWAYYPTIRSARENAPAKREAKTQLKGMIS